MTVDDIIRCPKTIERKRRFAYKQENRHVRADISLNCEALGLGMTMFLRRLVELPENFTVGLRLDTPNESFEYAVVLVRFQGPHGGQTSSFELDDMHNDYHIHRYTEEDRTRHRKRASYRGPANFNCFEGAIIDFLEYCNIADPNRIFDDEREKLFQIGFDLKV